MEDKVNNDFNCVRVSYIPIFNDMPDHFDNILTQISYKLGPFNRVRLLEHPKVEHNSNDKDTIGFLELKDKSRHNELIFMLDVYMFHGRRLKAIHAYFHFNDLRRYISCEISCKHCNCYTDEFE